MSQKMRLFGLLLAALTACAALFSPSPPHALAAQASRGCVEGRVQLHPLTGSFVRGLGALSPRLAQDASRYGANVTMAVYDVRTSSTYAYNPYEEIEMASMFKIPIIVTLLHRAEQQGRCLTAGELSEATAMIEVSDNSSEVALYQDAGGYGGVSGYLASIGIGDLAINPTSLGYSQLSPISSVRLMDDLRAGRILTPAHCRFILNLMSHVVAYEQVGIAATAPRGAWWAMKVGYGPGPDRLWLMDSMGTVNYNGHAYDLAIYGRDFKDYASGAYVVNHLCAEAVQALVGVA